ncbi:YfgM family protein [Rivibacter subsaxonicus]|uniref:Ancillary SecYEG translocon subunit n=1 Tax=Rivibacter subsaxonicus TaxID=457575 RepID=A0A4Q7V9W6_9BURK|nr:tetratricopeptide repeat protein [Rivibacter subsaxonicus]RZT92517.1 putative negative regulator of RcsB-dependent stress response [Rivibacter subsaxonicus]
MATHLDLEEQEQLDSLKAFWKQYGNLITWVLIIVLGGFAAFNGWNWYQRDRASKASVLFDELERAAQAGDAERSGRVFADIKARYAASAFAEQAGLLAARVQAEQGQLDASRASLDWVVANAGEAEYRAIAQIRLAGLLLDQKKYDEALKATEGLASDLPKALQALAADRRGDILLVLGRADEARAAYQQAWDAMDPTLDYRNLIDAKLGALGAPAAAASAPATGASR